MSNRRFAPKRIGTASTIPRGRGIWIPGVITSAARVGGGGEYGARISDQNRTFAVIREPLAHRITFMVAKDIYDNWFDLKIVGDEEGDESKEFDSEVQKRLAALQAKRELTWLSFFERTYGWGILVLGYADLAKTLRGKVRGATELREIKAYGPPQISKVTTEKDNNNPRYGFPVMYHITRPGVGADMLVHHTRVIHCFTRRSYYQPDAGREEWKGISSLDAVWDDLVTLRNIRWGMGQTMYRYGSGFPDLTFEGATREQIRQWTEAGYFEDFSARKYFAHNEKQAVEFKGVAGHELNPMNYYLPIMENISAGTGIPLAILRGVQAGALTGSEVNQQEYYGLVSDEQSAYEPTIRKLINLILGFAEELDENREYEFDWQGGFELDEEKKARIDQLETQTLQTKGQWHTINEIRKMEDPNLEDLPLGMGDKLLNDGSQEAFDYHIREIPKSPRKRPQP